MSISSRLLGFATKLKPTFPDKWKGGRIEKIANYFHNIYDDYRTVAVETVKDMKDRPLKSSVYISLLTGLGILMKTRPSEQDFYSTLTENVSDLMLVSDLIRNPNSEAKIRTLSKAQAEQKLVCWNFGIISLMCKVEFAPNFGLYEAQCKYIKPHWTEFHKTVVDIGILGKWWKLEEAMKDYDIHPDEWQEDGAPNKSFIYYKDKSLVSWDMKIVK